MFCAIFNFQTRSRAKLAEKKQEIQNEQKNKQHTRSQNKDRGAR